MTAKRPQGLFITGTDTGVGKTYVAARIISSLRECGLRVGGYKPVASGCRREGAALVSDDAISLWDATGRNGLLDWVCPQRFAAPLAPYLAARQEGREVDSLLLRRGIEAWRDACDYLIVEGVGGLMTPLLESTYVVDLVRDFGYPLVIVAENRVGAINQVLQACLIAREIHHLTVAAVVLNMPESPDLLHDPSTTMNPVSVSEHGGVPVISLGFGECHFTPAVSWDELAGA